MEKYEDDLFSTNQRQKSSHLYENYSSSKTRGYLYFIGRRWCVSDTLKAFVITIKFDSNGLMLTTGTSFSTFVMDKTPDLLWDNAFRKFLSVHEIEFEEV